MFVNAKDTEINFRPRFADAQTYISHDFNSKLNISFLGNASINIYDFEPLFGETNFGTINSPKALNIFYEGQEQDRYETFFGALKTSYNPNKKVNLRFIASVFNTQEQEHFDLLSEYVIGDVNAVPGSENFGEIESVDLSLIHI